MIAVLLSQLLLCTIVGVMSIDNDTSASSAFIHKLTEAPPAGVDEIINQFIRELIEQLTNLDKEMYQQHWYTFYLKLCLVVGACAALVLLKFVLKLAYKRPNSTTTTLEADYRLS